MELINEIIIWLSDYSKIKNFKFVVGISGGIDSAVVSTLCCMTGVETHVLSLPITQKECELSRARNHIKWLETNFKNVIPHEYDLTSTFDDVKYKLNTNYRTNLSLANTKSRLRMTMLYQIASAINGLVVGTGNKIEDFGVGFFTKYGDGGVDISPIADLTKTEVRLLAKELKIIPDIITAKPTDGLWDDDRTDEDQLGATYEELERAMKYIEDKSVEPLFGRAKIVMDIYMQHNTNNKHKMVTIPIFKKNTYAHI